MGAVALGEKVFFQDHSVRSLEDSIHLWDALASACTLFGGGFRGGKQQQ